MASVANILLQVTGDSAQARRELEQVSEDLALFARQSAEAEAELDTGTAHAQLEKLKADLRKFAAEDASAEANVKIAKAMGEIQVLQAELERLDREDVEIDVDIRRGVVERIGALSGQVSRLAGGVTDLGAASGEAGGGVGGRSLRLGALSGNVGPLLIGLAAALPILGSLVGAAVALAGSLTLAVGGLGALGVAGAGVLIPMAGLVGLAVARFKQGSEAVARFRQSLGPVINSFKDMRAAADPAFNALADTMPYVSALLRHLTPAMMRFGAEAGRATRTLVRGLTSPAITEGLKRLADGAGKALNPMAKIATRLFRLFLNIANAAMPPLVDALRDISDGLGDWVRGTSNLEKTRGVIGGLVGHLKTWLDLMGSIIGFWTDLSSIVAPAGKSMVEGLTNIINKVREWIRSAEGQKRIKEFFRDTLPLVKELGKTVGKLIIIFLQFTQFVAPGVRLIFQLINKVLDAVIWLGEAWGDLTAKSRAAGAGLAELGAAFNTVKDAVVGVARAVIGAASDLVDGVIGEITGAAGKAESAGRALIGGVRDGFNAVRGAAIGVARTVARLSVAAIRAVIGAARNAARAVMGAVRAGFAALRGAVVSVARSIARGAVNAVRALVGAARSAGNAVMSAVRSGIAAVRGAVVSVARSIAQGAVEAVRNAVGAARDAGQALINGVADGMKAAIGAVTSVAKSIWNAINSALPDISISIKIPTPNLPDLPKFMAGVRDFAGGLAITGESGPELSYIPPGGDVFNAAETRRLLRSLASGGSTPSFRAPALAGRWGWEWGRPALPRPRGAGYG